MSLSIWKDKNKSILQSIRNYRYEIEKPKVLPILIEYFVINYGHDNLYGELGSNLKDFLVNIDLNHPELEIFVAKLFGMEGIEEIEVLHEIAAFCVRKKYDFIIDRLKNLLKSFVKNNLPHSGKTLGNPCVTNAYTRFLPKNKLWIARQNKKPQRILSKKTTYENVCEDENVLDVYHHGSDKSLQLKAELIRKKNIFDAMNCTHLSGEISSAIKKIDEDFISCNFGFRRLTLSAAANSLVNIIGSYVDVYLEPVKMTDFTKNPVLHDFVECCDNFSCFNNDKAVFDHYGLIKSDENEICLLVGERDLKTFFIGYMHHA
jgi:hypothetical protein